jgi:Tfp pilus assembly protein PilF
MFAKIKNLFLLQNLTKTVTIPVLSILPGLLFLLLQSFQPAPAIAQNTTNAIVHAINVNVRMGPSLDAPVVGKIVKKGTSVEIISQNGKWYFIHYDIIHKGWIYAEFVTPLFTMKEVAPEGIERIIKEHVPEKRPDRSISGRAYFDLGVFAFEEGDYQNAISNFEQAIKLNPKDPEFHHYMGKTYLGTKQYEKSEKFLTKAWKMAPLLSDISKDRAILYYRQSNFQSAANLFLDIIRQDPSDIMSTYYAANCLYKQKDYYQAGQLFQKAAKSPSIQANCLYYAGICYIKTGLPQKGRQLLMKVQNNPKAGELKSYSSKWISALDKKMQIKKDYALFAQLSYQYDSNIRLEPIDEDLYTDEDDYCTSFLVSGHYTFADIQPYQFSAGMTYFKYLYKDYSKYDMDGHMMHLNTKLDLQPVVIGLNFSPSIFWLDSEQYLKRMNVTPMVSYQFNPQLRASISFANMFDNNLDNDGRDAHQAENELTFTYIIPKKNMMLFSTFGLEIMNADNNINDYDLLYSKAGIRMQKVWGFTFGLSGQYDQKKYEFIDPVYDAIRDDYRYLGTLYMQRSINPWLGIKTEYKFTKNSSNISLFNYERSSVTFSLTANH